jgi:valyl-tRNA synthetase
MSGEIARTYDPASIEAQATKVWLEEHLFFSDAHAPGEPYSIVIPPPNVTGALHLGHAINNTLQDILTRTHRMRGCNAVWIPGIDHAGIATQAVVEKQLKERENKTRHDVGREELIKRIWQWKEQYGIRIIDQLKRMGCSCDWSRTAFTLDEQRAFAVRETFFKLFRDGLIYRGKRLVNWDVHLQTSISDDEIYHETVKTSMWHIRYPIEGTDKSVIVATTRPETMLGDTAVAVHSLDTRWNWAIGKMVELPLTGRKIPIIADDILVDPKFGSGVVKVTPAHDPNDYAVWQRHQRKADAIDIINILNPDGTLNSNAGKFAGMNREIARRVVVEELKFADLLAKEEPYETQVGHSDRSKTPVEPYLSDQWFVKMAPIAEPALEVVRNGTIKFFPERHAQQYLSWLGEKRDWVISRQLWWGHRIPVWKKESAPFGPEVDLATFPITANSISWTGFQTRPEHAEAMVGQSEIDENRRVAVAYCCVAPGRPEIEASLEASGFVQDPDVLDTWFSSALWPHSTLGWPEDTDDLREWYPTSVLATGRDIITLWVARMVVTGIFNMRKDGIEHAVPFHHVYIHPTILDGKGERMSKSKGNGVDPIDIIETHGADAMRFTLTLMATETQDVRMPVKKDAQGRNTSDKFDIGRNFCNKIWNVANFFVIPNLQSVEPEPVEESRWTLADRWIISRFNRAVADANAALSQYRFDQYAKVCYDFFWNDFCDWYVEICKPALKDSSAAGPTANILAAILDGSLRLMHPMIPFITETIWWRLNDARPHRGLRMWVECTGSTRLIKAAWPDAGKVFEAAEAVFPKIVEIVKGIRKLRNDYKADLKKVLNVSIHAPAEVLRDVEENSATIQLLANCKIMVISDTMPPIPGVAQIAAGGCDVYVDDLIDKQAQMLHLVKREHDLTKQEATLQARLSSQDYLDKAPPHLVYQTKMQLQEVQQELEKVRKQLGK